MNRTPEEWACPHHNSEERLVPIGDHMTDSLCSQCQEILSEDGSCPYCAMTGNHITAPAQAAPDKDRLFDQIYKVAQSWDHARGFEGHPDGLRGMCGDLLERVVLPALAAHAPSTPHPDDCDCIGAVIGQHERSCRFASQPPAAPVETDRLLQRAVIASGTVVQDHLPCSADNAELLDLANTLIGLQEDMSCSADRDTLGYAAHYLRKFALINVSPQRSGEPEEVLRLRAAMDYACDLLAERTYGSSARSPGHNARLHLEATLSLSRPHGGGK